ncbi:MAG: peptide-methionine (S)-S-oxide reductase MsrA [Chitinophagales bacterium]
MTELSKATFGAGCFWCVEAVFQDLKGVHHVESGYSGGHVKNPTYREICDKRTGHAEVIRIHFDAAIISFEQLLTVLWHTHNPTTPNQQGNDKGPQYRSAIFYHNESQRQIAQASLSQTDASDLWANPIVTEISPLINYYKAENYHQNYFKDNSYQPYCSFVIAPKMKKFRTEFADLLVS